MPIMHLMTARGPIALRTAALDVILPLRHRVLRAGLPLEAAYLPGDEAETALHLAAFSDGSPIACATFHPRDYQGEAAWQLRGMAVAEGWRGLGIGGHLLDWADTVLRERSPIRLLWCNARVTARGFYERRGWRAVSEVFDVPTAGPHIRMMRRLE